MLLGYSAQYFCHDTQTTTPHTLLHRHHKMKPFSLTDDYHDQGSYVGRVLHFYDVINPLRLFTTNSDLETHKALLSDFEHGKIEPHILKSEEMNKKLWNSRSVLSAVLHPDTKERVFPSFMPCAFIPANVPICAGMLLTPPTPFNTALWQWVNQSYNAGFNYANRPISGEVRENEVRDATLSYVSATGVSCSVALGMNHWLKTAKLSPSMARNMGIAIPFIAVAGAGSFNVFAMRSSEIKSGVEVSHPETGESLGMSVNVAYAALGQCALSRVVLPAPILLIPPYMIPVVRSAAPRIAANKLGKALLDLSVLITCLVIALPPAIALFPQKGAYDAALLEPELKEKAEKVWGLIFCLFAQHLLQHLWTYTTHFNFNTSSICTVIIIMDGWHRTWVSRGGYIDNYSFFFINLQSHKHTPTQLGLKTVSFNKGL